MGDWRVEVPPARSLPPARRAAELELIHSLATAPEPSSSNRSLALLAGGVALATATGAAFGLLGSGAASDRSEVRCHTTVEAARGVGFAGAGVVLLAPLEVAPDQEFVAIRSAVGLCGELWEQGVLRPGAQQAMEPTGRIEPVPPLTACLTPDGVAAVFPTDLDVCASLGLRGLEE